MNFDLCLKEFVKKRQTLSDPEMGSWLKSLTREEWNKYFLSILPFVVELDWQPTAVVHFSKEYSREKMERFLLETCSKRFHVWSTVCVVFENKNDAIMFRLTWNY